MWRSTGTALAFVAAFAMAALSMAEAGERRSSVHTVVKKLKLEMRRHGGRHDAVGRIRLVDKDVVVLKLDRQRIRHRRPHSYGTYSGIVSVQWQNGVGQWTYAATGARQPSGGVPSAKIIDVGTIRPGDACDMQAGVCVIRP